MKNPNDSFWTTYSDVRLPEYDPVKRGSDRRHGSYCLEGTQRDRRRGERRRLVSQRERDFLMGEV